MHRVLIRPVSHEATGLLDENGGGRADGTTRTPGEHQAAAPYDGEACWDVVNDEERAWYIGVDDTGFGVPPMPFFDDRATAHPLATVMQPLHLSGDLDRFRRREYVYALDWPGESPLRPSYDRVRDDPRWNCHELDGKHNLMRDNPEDLLRILLDVAGR